MNWQPLLVVYFSIGALLAAGEIAGGVLARNLPTPFQDVLDPDEFVSIVEDKFLVNAIRYFFLWPWGLARLVKGVRILRRLRAEKELEEDERIEATRTRPRENGSVCADEECVCHVLRARADRGECISCAAPWTSPTSRVCETCVRDATEHRG